MRLLIAVLVTGLVAAGCSDDGEPDVGESGSDSSTSEAGTDPTTTSAGTAPAAEGPDAFDLSALDGDWISEADFLDAPELTPSFERIAELNPGHDAASARAFWEAFRASDWATVEIAAPVVSFQAADGAPMCEGPFEAVGTRPVGVSSWASDQEAHPPRDIPVNVFEFAGAADGCDEAFRFVWFLGAGDHGHVRHAPTLDEVTAPVPWWPTLRPSGMTVESFAEDFSALVDQLAGALPPADT